MDLNKIHEILLFWGFSIAISVLVQYKFPKTFHFCQNKSQPKLRFSRGLHWVSRIVGVVYTGCAES